MDGVSYVIILEMDGAINVAVAHNPTDNAERYCRAAVLLLGSTAVGLQLGSIFKKKKKKTHFNCAIMQ